MTRKIIRILLFALAVTVLTDQIEAQSKPDFSRDIRPILADKCFQCHGPDEASREAGLRLDVESEAHQYAFVPEALEESEAWQRIQSNDSDMVMPPVDSHKELKDSEKDLIKQWIVAGARYDSHWAFRAIASPEIPVVNDRRFSRSAIDAFVFQAMVDNGLQPADRASKESLIRRATLDLTGLPPTLVEVRAFLADQDSNAFEKVVDRLLASPRFGERMAVDWLDIARYGDTSVFHADGPRDMWRWRDWVVDAYNSNMPFDQFTIKQLAGDLLPDRTVEDHLASGFNRNNASTDEGGAIAEEFRIEYAVDRVKTTSMVWMGLSMECAQCHDHKYDPVSQEDYYRFFAFFNQAADPGMQTRRGNQAPIVDILDQDKIALVPEVEGKINDAKSQLAELRKEVRPEFEKWLTSDAVIDQTPVPPDDTIAHFEFDESDTTRIANAANVEEPVKTSGKPKLEPGKLGTALRTNGNNYLLASDLANNFAGDTEISYGCWVKLAGGQSGAPLARMDEGKSYVGFDLYLENNGIAAHFVHQWPGDAVKVIAKQKLEKGKWYHLFVTYDGSKKSNGIKIFVDGQHVESKPSHDSLTGSTVTDVPFTIGRRRNSSQFNGWIDDVRIYERLLSDSEVAIIASADPLPDLISIPADERTEEQNAEIFEIYLDREVKQNDELERRIAGFESEVERLRKPVTSVMVMKDESKRRMTYVLDRGQYDSPNKERPVTADVPAFLPDFEGFEKNRLGMAKWLMSPDHPLTARVAVNRIWKNFFGTGIVESAEDFGMQGTWPSHPELLDWLAHDFANSGWDTKRLIKMILMSQVYQQSSVVTPSQRELDPRNKYLSRGSRFRLAGEFLRDQALSLSGLLNPRMGGPGVKPYQPDGLWNEVSLNGGLRFRRDSGEKLYRRSLYTYWKRSAPPPNMVIFDAPTREKCIVRRGKTNTPLQALVLMNDPQFVEAARFFAERIMREGGETIESRIQFAFRTALSRKPGAEEIELIKQVFQGELQTFQEQPEQADKLLAVGEKKRDSSLSSTHLAAWTIIGNLIFNLDEFVTRG